MPYISAEARAELLSPEGYPKTPGELNFLITMLIQEYALNAGNSYTVFNDIVGSLECCKQEFLRRVVGPYEQKKIELNGDCYDEKLL